MDLSFTRRHQLLFLQNTTILSYKTPIKIMSTKNNVQVFSLKIPVHPNNEIVVMIIPNNNNR